MTKKILISDYVKNEISRCKEKLLMDIQDYADSVGVSHTVIRDIMKGNYNSPSPLTATRMCKWFDLEPDDLFKMIKNVDEDFINKFIEIYNKNSFDDYFISGITYFYKTHSDPMLEDSDEPIEYPFDDYKNYSLSNLKFIDTSEDSVYKSNAINATCTYHYFDIERIPDGDDPDMLSPTDYITCKELDRYPLSIYFLPPKEIRKKVKKTYEDEEFRDFTNKFINLIVSKDAPENNIFLTTSKKLYNKILSYVRGINITPTNPSVGIALVYCSYRKVSEHEILIDNGELIQYGFI